MKAKLMIDGKEFDVEILDPKLQELIAPKQKTGYEWVERPCEATPIYCDWDGEVERFITSEPGAYDVANYYSSEVVAENNGRADKLMRQLRRFSVQHRKDAIDWDKTTQDKYYIFFNHEINKLVVETNQFLHIYGTIYFDSRATAQLAIDTFHEELIWYFTEYKDSL